MFRRFSQNYATELLARLCDVPFSSKSRDRALEQIASLGKDLLYSHTCSIVLIDRERSVLTTIACSSSSPEMERLLQNRLLHLGSGQPGDWIALNALKEDQLEKVYDLDINGKGVANPKTARAFGIKSMLSYPLI